MKYFLLNMTFGIMAETQDDADHIANTVKEQVADAIPAGDPEKPGVFEMFAGEPFEDEE